MGLMPKSGFTLIELLVVLSIMAVLGIFSIANFSSFGEEQKLKGVAFDIQSLIKTAQTNAISRVSCPIGSTNYGAVWWVDFRTGSSALNLNCQIGAGTIQLVKTYIVTAESPNLQIDSVSCDTNAVSGNLSTAKFAPLTGVVSLDNGAVCNQYLNLTLKNTKINETKRILIDKGGTISVK